MDGQSHQAFDPVKELIIAYGELNSDVINEIYEAPSALEFMRYVAQNRPFVVRGGVRDWSAIQKWNLDYLKLIMKDETVNVAVTPNGYVFQYARWSGAHLWPAAMRILH